MYTTPLQFAQVLDRFYQQDRYDYLLLFVSSFDDKDKTILKKIVDNAKRIDRITGNRICFFYFIKNAYDRMNEKLVRWVKYISDWAPLYGEGVDVTMETADDICRHFRILRSCLPAFILVDKNCRYNPQVLSIRDYQDFENLLTPLNILHSYLEDIDAILNMYENDRNKNVITQSEVDKRNEIRQSWIVRVNQLERKKAKELSLRMVERADNRNSEIEEIKRKLEKFPALEAIGVDESIVYPHKELS